MHVRHQNVSQHAPLRLLASETVLLCTAGADIRYNSPLTLEDLMKLREIQPKYQSRPKADVERSFNRFGGVITYDVLAFTSIVSMHSLNMIEYAGLVEV